VRILIFNWRDQTHPWAGGAEVYLHELATRWVKTGHEVTWFCSRHPSQSGEARLDEINIIRRGGFYSVFASAPVVYLSLLARKFDVILDSSNGLPFFSPLFSRIPKVILVHHVHTSVFYRELPFPQAVLADFLERCVVPRVYRNTPFIAVSQSTRMGLQQIGVNGEQISLVYNGVDCERYRPGAKDEKPLVVYLGRLRHYKSIDTAIRSVPRLREDFPDLKLCIAGSGPALGALEKLSEELGVRQQVSFLGWISEAQKIQLLQHAHVVVNPSLKEGWGLTVLEANACGTPVVGADVPGLRDSIQDGLTGILVNHGDPQALAVEVGRILSDSQLRKELGRQARTWAQRFDWGHSASQSLSILERAARRSDL